MGSTLSVIATQMEYTNKLLHWSITAVSHPDGVVAYARDVASPPLPRSSGAVQSGAAQRGEGAAAAPAPHDASVLPSAGSTPGPTQEVPPAAAAAAPTLSEQEGSALGQRGPAPVAALTADLARLTARTADIADAEGSDSDQAGAAAADSRVEGRRRRMRTRTARQ